MSTNMSYLNFISSSKKWVCSSQLKLEKHKMKKFGLILAVVASIAVPAYAQSVGPDSSWDEILQSSQYRVSFPVVFFGNTGLPVNALCVDGGYLHSVEPVNVCLDWDVSHMRCERSETMTLSTSIDHMEERCIKRRRMRCLETEIVPVSHPLDYKISVYQKVRYPSRVAFRKNFTIPSCE